MRLRQTVTYVSDTKKRTYVWVGMKSTNEGRVQKAEGKLREDWYL